jgi:GntR family transcriptional regulator
MSEAIIAAVKESLAKASVKKPLYQQLALALLGCVVEGVVVDGMSMPSERRLSQELGISRVTVRRALDLLSREGRVHRQQGAQTRVVDRVQKALSTITGFSEELSARGSVAGHRWISKKTVIPTPSEALALGLSASDMVVRLVRIRTADGRPLAIERATIPQAILPSGDVVEDSLYAVLRALGAAPVQGTQRIRAGLMSQVEADLLEAELGSALLIIERRCCLADGRAVEFTETRYNGALYDFFTDLGR